jgi:hypothetical protein
MNDSLQGRNFLQLPQFISQRRAQALAKGLAQQHALMPMAPDLLVPGSPAVYDFLPFVRLLIEKIPEVEVFSEEKVLPTYTYARLYGHGEVLPLHEDRDACELSLTLNLDADVPWPIWLQTPAGDVVSVRLQPGDAVMYLGCQTPHWREPFEGQFCAQVFMHYVFAFGTRAYAYFDKKRIR